MSCRFDGKLKNNKTYIRKKTNHMSSRGKQWTTSATQDAPSHTI